MEWSWNEHECPGWSFDMSTNVRGGHLMWARMSGVVIWCEHECPGWSFDVSTNVRPCQKSRGNECPWERMSGIRASLKSLLSKDAILKLWFINRININVILKHMIIVSCFISGHLRQKFIEIFSFFSERAVTHAHCAGCHSSSFRPWVLHHM